MGISPFGRGSDSRWGGFRPAPPGISIALRPSCLKSGAAARLAASDRGNSGPLSITFAHLATQLPPLPPCISQQSQQGRSQQRDCRGLGCGHCRDKHRVDAVVDRLAVGDRGTAPEVPIIDVLPAIGPTVRAACLRPAGWSGRGRGIHGPCVLAPRGRQCSGRWVSIARCPHRRWQTSRGWHHPSRPCR